VPAVDGHVRAVGLEVREHRIGVHPVTREVGLWGQVHRVVGEPDAETKVQQHGSGGGGVRRRRSGRGVERGRPTRHESIVAHRAIGVVSGAFRIVHVNGGVADARQVAASDRQVRASGSDAGERLSCAQRWIARVREPTGLDGPPQQLVEHDGHVARDRSSVGRRSGGAQHVVLGPGQYLARYVGRAHGNGDRASGVHRSAGYAQQSAAGNGAARRTQGCRLGVDEPELVGGSQPERAVRDAHRARRRVFGLGRPHRARDRLAVDRLRVDAIAAGHRHRHLSRLGQQPVVADCYHQRGAARPRRRQRFHGPDGHFRTSADRRFRGVVVVVVVVSLAAGRPVVVLEQARALVPGRTPFVVGRRRRGTMVPKTRDASVGLAGHAVAILRVVHGEVVVGSVVDAQRHSVELDAVPVDGQSSPLLVESQTVVVDRRALDRVLVLVHRTVVRRAQHRARHVSLGQVPHEAALVVRHPHPVRERQQRVVRELVDGRQSRTVSPDVHRQQFRSPSRFHARLPFQRPAARRSLGASRARPRYRAIIAVIVYRNVVVVVVGVGFELERIDDVWYATHVSL